jgi:hypothetical protein
MDERLDIENIVMRACALGCDTLYERGYMVVVDGRIVRGRSPETPATRDVVDALVGRVCPAWNSGSESYFKWHSSRVL